MRTAAVLALLGLVSVLACQSRGQALRVFAPRCANLAERDLGEALGPQVGELDRSLERQGLDVLRLDQPEPADLIASVRAQREGWFFFLYTGHGTRQGAASSAICTGSSPLRQAGARQRDEDALLSVNDEILAKLPRSLAGATLVVDACESADVDPRRSAVPASVISSSPYSVGADSLFGDRLAAALSVAANDANCDGLVTDQEVFDALFGMIVSEVSASADRAFPKLRRNASAHLPLPIGATPRSACEPVREAMTRLARNTSSEWSELARALSRQLALVPAEGSELPETRCDFFVFEAGNDASHAEIAKVAEGAGLCRFPGGDGKLAREVARFATFAEVYSFSLECPASARDDPARRWVRVTRLRDGALVAVEPLSTLGAALPRRKAISVRRVLRFDSTEEERKECVVRYTHTAPSAAGTPVPCGEPQGQCFAVACEEVGVKP